MRCAREATRRAGIFSRGLWHSGLRLREACDLAWDLLRTLRPLRHWTGHVVLEIPAENQKNKRDQTYQRPPTRPHCLTMAEQDRRASIAFDRPRSSEKAGERVGHLFGTRSGDGCLLQLCGSATLREPLIAIRTVLLLREVVNQTGGSQNVSLNAGACANRWCVALSGLHLSANYLALGFESLSSPRSSPRKSCHSWQPRLGQFGIHRQSLRNLHAHFSACSGVEEVPKPDGCTASGESPGPILADVTPYHSLDNVPADRRHRPLRDGASGVGARHVCRFVSH